MSRGLFLAKLGPDEGNVPRASVAMLVPDEGESSRGASKPKLEPDEGNVPRVSVAKL